MSDGEESSPLVVETEAAASPMRYSHILRDEAAEVAAAAGGVFLAWTLKRHVVCRDLNAVVAAASNKRRLMLFSMWWQEQRGGRSACSAFNRHCAKKSKLRQAPVCSRFCSRIGPSFDRSHLFLRQHQRRITVLGERSPLSNNFQRACGGGVVPLSIA